MAKTVLINAPIILDGEDGDERSYYPLNILYLASALEAAGHEVKIYDLAAMGMTLQDTIDALGMYGPHVVGISAMTPSIKSAVTIAKAIQNKFKDYMKVGLGGPHICADPTFCKRNPYFDFWLIGEGEITLPKIVAKIEKGKLLQKEWHGQREEDLDSLAFPARHLINPEIYKRKEQLKHEVPAAGILSSRGCPYNCIFCSITNRNRKVRFRSARNVVDEMESVYEQCNGSYSFVDDCFTINPQRTAEICQEIIDRKITCRWIASTRPDACNEKNIPLLKRAGCRELYFGVESGSEVIRNKVIGKSLSINAIKNAVDLCKKYGIMSNLFLMMGFPGETKKDLQQTIEVGNKVGADAIGVHLTMPFPGTPLFAMAGLTERTIDDYANDNSKRTFRDSYPLFIPEGISLAELVEAKKKAYRGFYLSPQWILRRLRVWLRLPGRFKEDLKLFKLIPQVFFKGGTKGQLS